MSPLLLSVIVRFLWAYFMIQLSVKTVRKILRDAYKHLKELTNINRVPLNTPEDTVTVVSL